MKVFDDNQQEILIASSNLPSDTGGEIVKVCFYSYIVSFSEDDLKLDYCTSADHKKLSFFKL